MPDPTPMRRAVKGNHVTTKKCSDEIGEVTDAVLLRKAFERGAAGATVRPVSAHERVN